MKEADPIQVLGRGTDVQFTIDDTAPFEIVERSLREYLDLCRGLYSRGTVSVNVGRRILAPDQLSTIKGILADETGLTVTEYWCPPDILQEALASPDAQRALPGACEGAGPELPASPNNPPETPGQTGPEEPPHTTLSGSQGREASAPEAVPSAKQLQLAFPDLDARIVSESHQYADGNQASGPETWLTVGPVAEAEIARGANVEAGGNVEAEEGKPSETHEVNPGETHGSVGRSLQVEPSVEGLDSEPGQFEPPTNVDEGERGDSDSALLSPRIRSSEALIIKTNCRSGEVVKYHGDVVVFGDVNPGAEIVASGDIVVLGALRGMAHAGCEGDQSATIFALSLEAYRLQIGPHAGEAPGRQERGRSVNRSVSPKIAYLRRNSIFVAPFVRRREEYQGGVLYEG